MAHRQELEAVFPGAVSDVFTALAHTLAFRRWGLSQALGLGSAVPAPGSHYRCQAGSVLRSGRVVEVTRPVGLTLKEALYDPPCRVLLTLRWRIDPVSAGSSVRLNACYRLNHAALLRARHWERRLRLHFGNQLSHLALNLERVFAEAPAKRDLIPL